MPISSHCFSPCANTPARTCDRCQDVYFAIGINGPLSQLDGIGRFGDVAPDEFGSAACFPNPGDGISPAFAVQVGDNNLGAFNGEHLGDAPANSRSGSGYNCCFVC
jgi:hypothetical protein